MLLTASLNEGAPKRKFMLRSRQANNSLPDMVEQDFAETFHMEKSGEVDITKPNK